MRPWGASFILCVVITACGPTRPPVAPDPNAGGGESGNQGGGDLATVGVDPTPETICARIFDLKDSGCALTAGYSLSEQECIDDNFRALNERGSESHDAGIRLGHCLLDNDSCEAVGTCIQNLASGSADAPPTRACADDEVYAPVGISAAEFAHRRGAGMARFSQHASTAADPIEVCGIPAQMEWLMSLTCDDGSHPFPSSDHAHAARVRNVGKGGRCGAIIDLYSVPCPERAYSIFIDAYVCPVEDGSTPPPRPQMWVAPPAPPPPSGDD